MIGRDVLMAMLPEHLLLLGIVLLIVLEIAGLAQRASLTVALAAVVAAVWAAARLSFDGYASAPFAGHFSVNAATLLAKAAGVPVNPEIAVGALIPLVLWAVWRTTRRIHARLHAPG